MARYSTWGHFGGTWGSSWDCWELERESKGDVKGGKRVFGGSLGDLRGLKEGLRGALVSFNENPQQISLPQRFARPGDKGQGGVEGGSRGGLGEVREGSRRAKAASVSLAMPLERPFSKKEE